MKLMYAVRAMGVLNISLGVLAACLQTALISAGLIHWLGGYWTLAVCFSVLVVGLQVGVDLCASTFSMEFLSRHATFVKFLLLTQSPFWTLLNMVLCFLGAWKGLGLDWWQAALLIIGMVIVPLVAMTVQTMLQQRVPSSKPL